MTNPQRIYNLIANMGTMTVAEILEASLWPRWRVSSCLQRLLSEQAIRPLNIGGKRAYAPC